MKSSASWWVIALLVLCATVLGCGKEPTRSQPEVPQPEISQPEIGISTDNVYTHSVYGIRLSNPFRGEWVMDDRVSEKLDCPPDLCLVFLKSLTPTPEYFVPTVVLYTELFSTEMTSVQIGKRVEASWVAQGTTVISSGEVTINKMRSYEIVYDKKFEGLIIKFKSKRVFFARNYRGFALEGTTTADDYEGRVSSFDAIFGTFTFLE
jgi:hypothetical protein